MNPMANITAWSVRQAMLPMAHTPQVEGRLKAILRKDGRREMLTRRALIVAALAAGGVVAPLAALRPVAQGAAPPPTASAATVDPRAVQLLTRMVAAYKALHSYSGDEVAEGDPGLAMPYELSLTYQRPGRMLADITHHYGGKAQRSRVLLDGRALYLSSAEAPAKVSRVTAARTNYTLWDDAFIAREEVKLPLIADLLEQTDFMTKALTQPPPGTAVSLGAPSVVDGVPVDTVIERTARDGRVSTGVFQIGHDDHLLRRVTEDSRATYQNPSHVSQTFLHVRANPALPAATFVFTAPPGVVVTDEHPDGADADPAAVKLLSRMYAAYAALQSFSCEMNVTLHGPSYGPNGMTIATSPVIGRETFAVQKPNRVALTRTGGEGTSRAVSDGTNLYVTTTEPNGDNARLWRADAVPGRYLKLPLQADPGNVAYNLSNFGGLGSYGGGGQQLFVPQALLGWAVRPAAGYDWKMGPAGRVNGEPVETVTLHEGDAHGTQYSVLILAISPQDHLLRQVTTEYHNGSQPVQQEFDTFTNVKVNPVLPASLFVFTPPPGSRPVPLASDLVARR